MNDMRYTRRNLYEDRMEDDIIDFCKTYINVVERDLSIPNFKDYINDVEDAFGVRAVKPFKKVITRMWDKRLKRIKVGGGWER